MRKYFLMQNQLLARYRANDTTQVQGSKGSPRQAQNTANFFLPEFFRACYESRDSAALAGLT
jgi:hypothetical protein